MSKRDEKLFIQDIKEDLPKLKVIIDLIESEE